MIGRWRVGLPSSLWPSRTVALVAGVLVVLVVMGGQVAAADTGQVTPALGWIQLTDSKGINAWNYELSIDRGGLLAPGKFYWSTLVDLLWGLYRDGVLLAVWFIDWIISFDWVTMVATPVLAVGDSLTTVVTQMGLVPAFLTVAAFVSVIWMARGRWATGIFEFFFTLVLAALVSGFLAHPIHLVADPGSGLIYKARDAGFDFVSAMSAEGGLGSSSGTVPVSREAISGQLITTFIRQPLQMINFGTVLDGTSCESAYDTVIKAGPYGYADTIRNAINACDSTLGDYAAAPSGAMATGTFVLGPASVVLLGLAIALGGAVIAAAVRALYQGLKASITTVTGLLPGAARRPLFVTAAELVTSIGVFLFAFLFLIVYMQVIQTLFTAPGMDIAQRFVVVDVFMVVGAVVAGRAKRQLKNATGRLADLLATRPGGAPKARPLPAASHKMMTASSVISAATSLARLRNTITRGQTLPAAAGAVGAAAPGHTGPAPSGPGPSGPTSSGPAPSGFSPSGPVAPAALPPSPSSTGPASSGPASSGSAAGPSGPGSPGGTGSPPSHPGRTPGLPAGTVRALALTAGKMVGQHVLSVATGGASTAVIAALRVLPKPRPEPPQLTTGHANQAIRLDPAPGAPQPLPPAKRCPELLPGPSILTNVKPVPAQPGPAPKPRPPVKPVAAAGSAVRARPEPATRPAAPGTVASASTVKQGIKPRPAPKPRPPVKPVAGSAVRVRPEPAARPAAPGTTASAPTVKPGIKPAPAAKPSPAKPAPVVRSAPVVTSKPAAQTSGPPKPNPATVFARRRPAPRLLDNGGGGRR